VDALALDNDVRARAAGEQSTRRPLVAHDFARAGEQSTTASSGVGEHNTAVSLHILALLHMLIRLSLSSLDQWGAEHGSL
jgi:hypothetical protein